MPETATDILISSILIDDRIRKDMGDIDELANSIKAVGLIQPVIVTRENKLIAGERRLRAMKKLGVVSLVHGKTFIYNDEVNSLKIRAMESEEEVKQKQHTCHDEL